MLNKIVFFLDGPYYTCLLPYRERLSFSIRQKCLNSEINSESEEKAEEYDLGKVVVTGTKRKSRYKDSPVPTRIISRQKIENTGSSNLFEALEGENGVIPMVECGNCYFTEVRINGLGNQYNQILINGLPLFGSLSSVYILQQLPETIIGNIELIKGGGSALYGGGAVGGIIDVQLRRPDHTHTEIKTTESRLDGRSGIHELSFNQSHISENGLHGFTGFGSLRMQDPYDYNNDGFSELGKMRGLNAGFTGFVAPSVNSELTYMAITISERRRGGNDFDEEYHNSGLVEALESDMNIAGLKWSQRIMPTFDYDLYASMSHLKRRSYFGANKDFDLNNTYDSTTLGIQAGSEDSFTESYGRSEEISYVSGTDFNFDLGKYRALLGYQLQYDQLKDRATGRETTASTKEINENHGLITQAEWLPTGAITLLAGLRTDFHNKIDDPILSPRINLLYNITKNLDLRTMYSAGFTAPRTYIEDLHLGVYEGEPRDTRNAENLKPEKSDTYGGNLVFQKRSGNLIYGFETGGYYTKIKDAFNVAPIDTDNDGTNDYNLRTNSSGATSIASDLSINGGYDFGADHQIDVSMGVNYTNTQYDVSQEYGSQKEKHFLRVPQISGNFRVFYLINRFTFNIDTVIMGPMQVFHERVDKIKKTGSFFDMGTRIAYTFYSENEHEWEVFAGIKNIFDSFQQDIDTGYDRDPAYFYGPALPRTFYFGTTGSF